MSKFLKKLAKRFLTWKWALRAFLAMVVLGLIGMAALAIWIWTLSRDLPNVEVLAKYEPPVMSRVQAGDGKLIAEYARQHRVFVPIQSIPNPVIHAFVSAEDKNFYQHHGIDWKGFVRAQINNIFNKLRGRRLEGASTLTQQVAENFLVDTQQNVAQKIRKMIIATRIEKAFTKDQILELYLNEIYLGNSSYGVAAAALNYFGKPLDKLSLSEMAFLAALPKGPSNYNPERHHDRAVARRNWVLSRMEANGYIHKLQEEKAIQEPLVTVDRLSGENYVAAAYFVESIRRRVFKEFGEDQLYDGGLSIRTTVDTQMQQWARTALRTSLEEYDRRHGYRGPIAKASEYPDLSPAEVLGKIEYPKGMEPSWRVAYVTGASEKQAELLMMNGDDSETGILPLGQMKWARKELPEARVGAAVKKVSDVLHKGDVVLVAPVDDKKDEYTLEQIPQINGAIMAMDPHTGRVLAMVGGYSFARSQFNRATQAQRQIGSAFKPFVYMAALDNGYTPVSKILDAPFVADGGADTRFYKPENYESGQYYGMSTLRRGVEKSRNVMTVRLAQEMGMQPIVDIGERTGIYDNLQPTLAMSLGAGETTLWRLMGAYAAIVNGGHLVKPIIIDRVQDREGKTIEKADKRDCPGCNLPLDETPTAADLVEPVLPDARPQVLNPVTAYQMVSILEGVVQRGTGVRLRSLGKVLAGKTGTTNDYKDAWFMGFSPDLVVGVYTGFDTPSTLGHGEAGARVALPVFKRFMAKALKDTPNAPFRIPDGVSLVWVNSKTGDLSRPNAPGAILEAFKPGTEPTLADRGVRLTVGGPRPKANPDDKKPDDKDKKDKQDDLLDGVY